MNPPRNAALWLSGVTLLAQLPHWPSQPWPLLVFWTLLFIWHGISLIQHQKIKGNYWLIPIALAMAVLIFREYRSLVGSHAGVAFLTSLITLKLLESRTTRDARLLLGLDLFNTTLHFLVSQTPWMALYSLSCTLLILGCWLKQERPEIGFARHLKTAATLILQGLPIAIVMFVFFPRLTGPLWAMPGERTARSGLSAESLDPGSISQLALDDSVAFRVEFASPLPSQEQLYWRSTSYEFFDGQRWLPASQADQPAAKLSGTGEPVRYAITLEAHQQRWLPALDMPTSPPESAKFSSQRLLRANHPITQRERYEMSSFLDWHIKADPLISRMLHLPRQHNPKAWVLAEAWRSMPAKKRVATALHFFASQGFAYTLEPPLLTSQDPIDEFLFTSRLGFCEHFASAFTWLMRAADVPARIIGGYQGGTFNPTGNYLIVRQADAHAWVEVWLEGQGWQRVDPTAVVAPARIREGLARSLPRQADQFPLMLRDGPNWLKSLQLNADALLNTWNQWVIAYNLNRQMTLLKRIGIDSFLDSAYLIWLSGLTALVFLGLAIHLLRSKHKANDPATQIYQRFLSKLNRLGIQKENSEGFEAFARRASLSCPQHAELITQITTLYLHVRYADQPAQIAELRNAVQQLQPRQTRG